MSTKLHNAFVDDATLVREALGEMNVPNFELSVTISGRTLSDADECKIVYEVQANWDNKVKGDSVEACLDELKRRLGWHKKHTPIGLAAPRTNARDKVLKDSWNYEGGMDTATKDY